MKKLILTIAISQFLFHSFSQGQSLEPQDYQSYNQIVDDLHSELETKTETTQQKLMNSAYSLSAGLQTQFLKVNQDSASLFGVGGEIGIYNFLIMPFKVGLDFVSGSDIESTLFHLKTDRSVYKYDLIDVKLGLAGGIGSYKTKNDSFTSLFIAPSVAGFYQVHRNFDLSFQLSYAFHASDEVVDHISPSFNLVSYF